ncbi:MAG TPA: porin [Rhizobacter sp.]|jgi:predicted porin|nr:porin [Rhizobacter sp.]
MKFRTVPMTASLLALACAAHADDGVVLSGVMDLAVRASNRQGPAADQNRSTLVSGGLSPSRLQIDMSHDVDADLKAIGQVDFRFQADTGVQDVGPFWQESWVGLKSRQFGQLTLGRQFNVLSDVATTFAAFRTIGPFLNSYKPEVGLAMGVRSDNAVKYLFERNGFAAELQASAGEGQAFTTTQGKSFGGLVKYSGGPLGAGAGWLKREDEAGREATGVLVGASWTAGAMYLNAYVTRNSFADGFNAGLLLLGTGFENALAPSEPGQSLTGVNRRDMWSFGGTYAVSAAWQIGAQYWDVKQSFHAPLAPDARGQFVAVIADYKFSKRVDVYAALEHTSLTDYQLTDNATGKPNGATDRSSVMTGLRLRF